MDSWFFLFFLANWIVGIAGSERGKEPSGRNVLRLIQIRLATLIFEKMPSPVKANHRFEFHKSGQLFIRAQSEGLTKRDVRLQSRSFARWNQSLRPSPTPTGLAEIVSDDLPILHLRSAIQIFDSSGKVERVIPFNEADRKL